MNKKEEYRQKYIVELKHGSIVEAERSFANSIYSSLYEKAGKIVANIVDASEGEKRENLLAILGERGSGKTTAMLSFLNALGEYPAMESGEKFLQFQKEARFITFDAIDASMLEEKEDLFEIVLAKMLVPLIEGRQRNSGMNYSGREAWMEIQKKFNQLFENFRMIKGNRGEDAQEPLVALKNLSISSGLKEKFAELVKLYVTYRDDSRGEGIRPENTYLVFAVDDLDMNIEHGFEMLGQIHRYLLVPHVIIMVTAKYEQLEILGRKYFANMFEKLDRETEIWKVEYLMQMTKEYLEKMLPLHYRLYLPQFTNMTVDFAENIRVAREQAGVKEVILGKISRRLNIFFDGSNARRHYLEPDSMRGLNNYYWFLEGLDKVSGGLKREGDLNILEKNYNKFLNDFIYRYVVERLNVSERSAIAALLECPVAEWNQYLRNYLDGKMNGEQGRGSLWWMFSMEDGNFGTVLWGLYSAVEDGGITKDFMNCVVTLYSLMLSRGEWYRRLGKETEERKQEMAVLESSAAGMWTNGIFPYIQATLDNDGRDQFQYMGECPNCDDRNIGIQIHGVEMPGTEKQECSLAVWLGMYPELVRTTEILLLFFENFYDADGREDRLELEYVFNESEEGKANVRLRIKNAGADFNMFGFIKNLLEPRKYFDSVHEAMLKGLKQDISAAELKRETELLRKKNEVSMFHEFDKWNQKAYGMVLPVLHTDIYVNLLIELQFWANRNLLPFLTVKKVWSALGDVVNEMEKILERKADFYKADWNEGVRPYFVEYFKNCPVIQCIRGYGKKGLVQDFPEQFGDIVRRCSLTSNYANLYEVTDDISTTENVRLRDIR